MEPDSKWMSATLPGLRYRTDAGDEIAIIITAPPTVTEIPQNYKHCDIPWVTSSCLENLKWILRVNLFTFSKICA